MKVQGTIICFYDIWKIESLKNILETKFKQIRFIEWIKSNPVPINSKVNYLTNCREVAITELRSLNQRSTFMIRVYIITLFVKTKVSSYAKPLKLKAIGKKAL